MTVTSKTQTGQVPGSVVLPVLSILVLNLLSRLTTLCWVSLLSPVSLPTWNPTPMEIIHFAELRTQRKTLFPAPSLPCTQKNRNLFLIQNWLVACGLTEIFYCQHSKQMQRLPVGKGSKALSQASKQLNTGTGSRERSRMGQFTQTWTEPPAGQDWPPRYHHAWVKGAGLEIPNCQVSFQFPASFSMLTGKNGGPFDNFISYRNGVLQSSTQLILIFSSFLYLFWLYHMAYGILVLESGTKPASPPLK